MYSSWSKRDDNLWISILNKVSHIHIDLALYWNNWAEIVISYIRLISPRIKLSLQQNVFLATKISEEIFFVTKNKALATKYEFRH